ncbi:hypothetical protein [Acetobacter estunensis]|uniref:hypothetical protein n=1 Tax=Acetobacter estunensis TaxID=104097 RepID=UPI001C2CE286|nr:hypothetical protein [Acetobacter estunensis]MBV1837179.1 hypothetical protein [Acetobacter estunensis]
MPTVTEEKPITVLVQDMMQAHQAARIRDGAPWSVLDGLAQKARFAAGRYNQTGANANSLADREAKARIRKVVEDAIAEFVRWRDMPRETIAREAAQAIAPAPRSAPTPEQAAHAFLEELGRRGIRLEIGSKNRLSVRPAHLLTDSDKTRLTTLRVPLAAAWLERNGVWVCE